VSFKTLASIHTSIPQWYLAELTIKEFKSLSQSENHSREYSSKIFNSSSTTTTKTNFIIFH